MLPLETQDHGTEAAPPVDRAAQSCPGDTCTYTCPAPRALHPGNCTPDTAPLTAAARAPILRGGALRTSDNWSLPSTLSPAPTGKHKSQLMGRHTIPCLTDKASVGRHITSAANGPPRTNSQRSHSTAPQAHPDGVSGGSLLSLLSSSEPCDCLVNDLHSGAVSKSGL